MAKVQSWNPGRGFGYVIVKEGSRSFRAFLHVSVIEPRQTRGADLNGTEIVVLQSEQCDNGPRVVSAITVEEKERREAQGTRQADELRLLSEQRQRDEQERRRKATALAKDAPRLEAIMPQVEAAILPLLPFDGERELTVAGETVLSKAGYSERPTLTVDPLTGGIQTGPVNVTVRLGEAVKSLSSVVEKRVGWTGVRLATRYEKVVDPFYRHPDQLDVEFVDGWSQTGRANYPAAAEAPRRGEGNCARNVYQMVRATTPLGEVVCERILYRPGQNPEPVAGPFEAEAKALIAAVRAEVRVEAEAALATAGEPKVEEFTFHQGHAEWTVSETLPGWEGSNSSRGQTQSKGEKNAPSITFFLGSSFISAERQWVSLWMDAGLDRAVIIAEVTKIVAKAIVDHKVASVEWRTATQAALVEAIMAQIPEFREEPAVWAVSPLANIDEPAVRDGVERLLSQVTSGFAVATCPDKWGNPLVQVATVVRRETAERLHLPGEALPGSVTVWWNHPVADEPADALTRAQALRERLVPYSELSAFSFLSDGIQGGVRGLLSQRLNELSVWTTQEAQVFGLEDWILRAEQILASLGDAISVATETKRRQEAGEILTNFEVHHRRGGMTGLGDGWVIGPDGSLRAPDVRDIPRHKSDGQYIWLQVEPGELALVYQGGGGDVAANGDFKVAHLPVGGPTPEQLGAVRAIELEDLKAPEGVFGFNPELNRQRAEAVAAICQAANRELRQKLEPAKVNYFRVIGEDGIELDKSEPLLQRNRRGCREAMCCGRTAAILQEITMAGSVLEFLAFDKFGRENLNMRWRLAET